MDKVFVESKSERVIAGGRWLVQPDNTVIYESTDLDAEGKPLRRPSIISAETLESDPHWTRARLHGLLG